MADNPKKLVTWKEWVLALSATAVGVSLLLYREYRDTGTVQWGSIALSVLAFCVGLGIIAVFFWYANKPEGEDKG